MSIARNALAARPLFGSVVLFWALSGTAALAVEASQCRSVRQQRDDLASEAMAAELVLVRQIRGRLCSAISLQAERANANQGESGPELTGAASDYQALIHCRKRTEQVLKASHSALYRNRLGFIYYSQSGASLATQADALQRSLLAEGCPAWLRGEPEATGITPR